MSEQEDFFVRAKSHSLTPTIVNKDSNFVVVTYWWGRGILNRNTQRPCPEERDEIMEWEEIKENMLKDLRKTNPSATKADLDPKEIEIELKSAVKLYNLKWANSIKFEEMIAKWEKACGNNKCNYLAEEYAEFAVKGGYQHAINFKPYFIDLALAACYPRGVLYIDGDMTIKKYPNVFDTKEVDYMARGWNVDPRAGPWDNPCFEPYILETSGGTMFFGNTYYGRLLLKHWQQSTLKYPGKADDRIISMMITMEHLLVPLSTIQLPVEYLWLSLDYDNLLKKNTTFTKKTSIEITHPECLTGEDRAQSDSSTKVSSRHPRAYMRAVENLIECKKNEIIYEYIHFNSKEHIGSFRPYLDWLSTHKVVNVVPYSKAYGSHTISAQENSKILADTVLQVNDQIVVVSDEDINTISLHKVSSKRDIPATILKYLLNNQHVVYVPKGIRGINTIVGKANNQHLDFITKNLSNNRSKAKKEYTLKLDREYPIYFGPNNKVLRHLLLMSNSISDLENIFNESYLFLTRIHCGWV